MRRFSIPVWVAVLAMGPWDDLAATQTLWRGLVVAPESRCSPYDADDYRYPQSVEDRIIAELGGVYGPYTVCLLVRQQTGAPNLIKLGSASTMPARSRSSCDPTPP